jgi:hypothetical protein
METREKNLRRTRQRLAREREAAALGQRGLFGDLIFDNAEDTPTPPLRSSNPPCTSRMAFETVSRNGTRINQKRELLTWLRSQTVPLTSAEISARSGFERFGVARRLSEIERDRDVRRRAARICEITGRPSIAWEAT